MSTDYIYESPDGGRTVFRRQFNSDSREMIYSTPDNWDTALRKINWHKLSQQFPAIEDKLQELLMLKNLVSND